MHAGSPVNIGEIFSSYAGIWDFFSSYAGFFSRGSWRRVIMFLVERAILFSSYAGIHTTVFAGGEIDIGFGQRLLVGPFELLGSG